MLLFHLRLLALCLTASCTHVADRHPQASQEPAIIRQVADIPLPEGYKRIAYADPTEAAFLRSLSLKKDRTVYLYNGEKKRNQAAHYAVLDLDAGTKDLQQCADAVMRLRAEYLWKQKRYGEIQFRLTNGFNCDYLHYRDGYRLRIQGNYTTWQPTAGKDAGYKTFRSYLDLVYAYASTRSLHGQLRNVTMNEMKPGDVFIQTGDPYGHAVTVMDMAYHPGTHDTIFLLSQSYMPAQDIHILINPEDKRLSPWYSTRFGEPLETPEWTFYKEDLKGF